MTRMQHVAREHVGEESDGERDQPHELGDDLEEHDQGEQPLGTPGGIQLLKYLTGPLYRMPSTCVAKKVTSASASVTLRFAVAA